MPALIQEKDFADGVINRLQLEPLMKRRTMRIKALEAYLSGDVPNSYLKIKYTV